MDTEELLISPLFVGLTRPPMIMGITLDYVCLSFMVAVCAFIIANSIFYILLYVPFHIVGWIACKIDSNIFRIIFKKLSCQTVPNKSLWGCQSYEPF